MAALGRGKVHHKGRRRHFTDADELRAEMERDKRQKDWRVNYCFMANRCYMNNYAENPHITIGFSAWDCHDSIVKSITT